MQALRPASAAVVLLAALSACSLHGREPSSRGPSQARVITADEIRRSGANTAWEALRRGASHLMIQQDGHGNAHRIAHRGRNSLLSRSTPLIVMDGTHVLDWTYLQSVPAVTVESIAILTGAEASPKYGTPAGNGAIVITTIVPENP